MPSRVTVELAGGKTLTLETGKIARQAGGAVVVRLGDTMVLATATSAHQPRENIDFFPLTVDYREYTYASGRFPGGYIKREGRPTEKEVLTSRQIDRPIRPLFAKGFRNETQVIALVLSADQDNDPDVLAVTGAGAALHISDIPFPHTLAGVRVAYVNGAYVCNPTYTEMRSSQLNIVVAGTADGISMVEAGAQVVSEELVVGAIEFGHEQIKKILVGIEQLRKEAGAPKRAVTAPVVDEAFYKKLFQQYGVRLIDALDTKAHPKAESAKLAEAVEAEALAAVPADQPELKTQTKKYFERMRERIFRDALLDKRHRPDGRAFDQIRSIFSEVGLLPRAHGSALFTRGETQALVTVTLGTKEDQQRIETIEGEGFKRFMLNYNFPPFSVGEVGFLRGPGRREIGHGALAERSQLSQLPPDGTFNYTIRVVSDIMESNGSSSMASVCGASLALADAGVPMQAPVAGIAMGLVKEGDKYAILTDIAGAEDHYGDMDFKVAGTREGITGLQMDIKIGGVTAVLMREALEQARRARLFILDKMAETIAAPRTARSLYAPQITTIKIPVDKIRDLIGPGGKMIRSIVEATGAKIDVSDDGTVNIAAVDGNAGQKALQMVSDVTASAEIGKTYLGKVVRIVDFGAFVEVFPGTDGLLRCINIEGNKVKLSRKAVLKEQREKLGLPLPPPPLGAEPAGEGGDSYDRPPRRDDDRGGDGPRRGGFRGGRGGRDRR